jgi:hypothetical protein
MLGQVADQSGFVSARVLQGEDRQTVAVGPRFSEQSLIKVRKAAVCMREHGITQFPDPTTTRPPVSALAGAREITDFNGAFLVFPSTLNMESPAYVRAATACGRLALKLGRGPH